MYGIALRSWLYLAFDVLLLILCALHVPSIHERAQAPFRLKELDGRNVVSEILAAAACPGILAGDELVSWQGHAIPKPEVIEFLADHHSIGDNVEVTSERAHRAQASIITLIPDYDVAYIVIVCFVSLTTWCLGIFVLLRRQRDLTATVMHWAMISMAVVVVIAFEGVVKNSVLGYLSCVLFFISYAGVSTNFLLLTTVFPQPRFGSTSLKAFFIYTPACVVVGIMMIHHFIAYTTDSTEQFARYLQWFGLFHLLTFLYIGAGIAIFIYSYLASSTRDVQKKLKWVLWGLCTGPTPFLFLVILPQVFRARELVPEEFALIFLLLIPIAFAIAFLRHHLLDIELVISRTTAYVIVLSGLLAIYVLIVYGVSSLVGQLTASSTAAVLVALLFEPARSRVQHFVDRRFFRVSYNFRIAGRIFAEEIKRCLTVQQLALFIVEHTDSLIPVHRLGFFTLQTSRNILHVQAHKGFDKVEQRGVPFEPEKLKVNPNLPIALDDKIEIGVPHESADEQVFHRWGMALVLPMLSEKSEFLGFLVFGERKSGTRFSVEDVDLLGNVATQAGLTIERIRIQHELLLKDQEAERLKALNQMKSDFVSYISHELRTPLTSIKLYAELLRYRPRNRDRKSQEYLGVIEGESERLDRMVTTILDSAKIEEGLQQYHLVDTDLREISGQAMKSVHYQLKKQGFRIEYRATKRTLPIHADPDAVAQAIINLIGNSIKYSVNRKSLQVTVYRKGRFAACHIRDKGRGISKEAIPHVFDRYYRDPAHADVVQGIGLGLPLVKHIMDTHGGSVDVKSALGKGSVFSLLFPLAGKTP